MKMNETVILDFIDGFHDNGSRKQVIETFMFGYCYWFARILEERFKEDYPTCLVYDQIDNHFGCIIGDQTYDITGNVTDMYDWEPWWHIQQEDELLAGRIVRDCIEKRPTEDK